ncbi:PAS domain S-box protein [Alteromonas sp. 1_MG-2023]|uniref:PAS domain-containing hybrid sensor histidine kinase/response regulator n=1 Tax=Alteromonas sp. 1_MG-2023 TaxID=3062669 RepID=UPI0026E149E5|nr:PAS domain-containing hybrid sensor histidine kinase/response regulator [Alteromonas sp. 1_MG-2023]MDO6565671.1 PAS domain S-box protein [Alteromonas sp. 1_MG-2023]
MSNTSPTDTHDISRLKMGLSKLLASVDETYQRFNFESDVQLNRPADIATHAHEGLASSSSSVFSDVNSSINNLRQTASTLLAAKGQPNVAEPITDMSSLSALVLNLVNEQQHSNNEMLIQRMAMDKHGIVVTLDLDGNILMANDKCCELSEFSREELIGNNADMLNVKNVPLATRIDILKSLFKGEVWHGELHSIARSGNPWFVFCTIVPTFNDEGRVVNVVVICTDISNQKKLEEKLALGRNFYQSITDSIGEGVYAIDANGKTQFLNPEATRLLGWELEDLQNQRFHNAVHYQRENGQLIPRHECPVNIAILEGETYTSDEDFFTDKRGRIFPISIIAVPLKDKHGAPNGHVGVFRDISGRKELERKLRNAYKEAANANKAKGDFLATMSHEIRTPMNAIIGLTHLALETENQAQQQNYMTKVKGSATSLLTLVNGILDFSKLEAQQTKFNRVEFNLAEMMNKLAQVFQHKARQKHLQLLFDMRLDTDITCKGDNDKIYQVLVNLIGNAIKFTERGFVKITVRNKGLALSFSVSDTGIGIGEKSKSKLFNAFVQADASISREYGGTGLGLAISKRLVELMNGTLEFTSELGKESHFSFTLPAMLSHNTAESVPTYALNKPLLCINTSDAMTEVESILSHIFSRLSLTCSYIDANTDTIPLTPHDVILLLPEPLSAWNKLANHIKFGEYEKLNIVAIITPIEAEEARRRLHASALHNISIIELPFTDTQIVNELFPPSNLITQTYDEGLESKKWRKRRLAGKHALLVDDDNISLEIAQQILLDSGFEVTTATTGEQAISLSHDNKFDVVLLDCILPTISGFTVAEELCNRPDWHCPIIALSADGSSENKQKASSAGMCAHLLKPASAAEILHVIDINITAPVNSALMHEKADPFLHSLEAFYLNYGNADMLAQLIDLMVESTDKHDAITSLLADAKSIGANTLVKALDDFCNSEGNDADYAQIISAISFALDATLRLIAHTLSLPKEYDEIEVDEVLSISDLSAVISSLESYDAEAVSLLSALYNQHATSSSAHTLNHARQLVSVYDYSRALEELVRLRDTLLNG